jgi:hypothetical protein
VVKTRLAILLLAAWVGAAACGSKNSESDGGNTPPTPTPTPTPGEPISDSVNGNVGPFAYVSHLLNVSREGNLTATLTWQGSTDLNLYLTAGTCADVYGSNACERLAVSDQVSGNSEMVTFTVKSGEQYKVWVDNFAQTSQAYVVQISIR